MPALDISDLARKARQFETILNRVKDEIAPRDFGWYPYNTLGVFSILEKLLTGANRRLLDLAGSDPLLDIGCADGALAFFFESLGCRVHAIDHPHSNFNRMRGAIEIRSRLHSSITLEAVDLDSQFALPDDTVGLALFLGLLYHLKNPFYVLEHLAVKARYCLLSTRIAERTPGRTLIQREPLTYLLAPAEANNDPTNYWIFSQAALERLLDRTGWDILDYTTIGCRNDSDPINPNRDQRAYALLRSRIRKPDRVKLLEGWHALEEDSFRWTARRFSVLITQASVSRLRLTFELPAAIIERLGAITLTSAGGAPQTYSSAGHHTYLVELQGPQRVDFLLDKALPASDADPRELGVLVSFWKPGLLHPDPMAPFELF
jgi:tRNA (mo5U34)-methyltransferase